MNGNFDIQIFSNIFVIRTAITSTNNYLSNKTHVTHVELFQVVVDECEDLNCSVNVRPAVTDST